jgi:predicted nucleotidyltransferase
MAIEKTLDNTLNSKSKIAIIRLFVSKTGDFKATGREIAKLTHFSAPAAHAALKELFGQGILKLDNIGKQHIYSLDNNNRVVQKILKPMFKEEISLKDEVRDFLNTQIQEARIKKKVVSLLLYGSLQKSTTHENSDVDIAVIIKNKKNKKEIEEKFLNDISVKFYDYFKAHLDTYIKTKNEFRARLKKNLPPVSTLMKSYSLIYGREPLEI